VVLEVGVSISLSVILMPLFLVLIVKIFSQTQRTFQPIVIYWYTMFFMASNNIPTAGSIMFIVAL